MKRLLSILTLALAVAAISVQQTHAQNRAYGSSVLLGSGSSSTTNLFALTTNNYGSGYTIDCRQANNVAITVYGATIVSNFCKPRFDFKRGVDGSNFDTTNLVSVTCLGGLSTNALGLGVVCYTTNIDVSGIGYLQLYQGANTDYHGGLTNLTVTYSIKKL